jgi:hypothetical protein
MCPARFRPRLDRRNEMRFVIVAHSAGSSEFLEAIPRKFIDYA